MKVFTLSKGWIVFILFFAVGFILGLLYYLILYGLPGILQQPGSGVTWFFSVGALVCIAFMCYAIVEAIKGKFVIEADRIYLLSAMGTRELLLSEIKGYRIDDKYIYIEPISKEKKKLKITKYFSNAGGIIDWLDARYPDLDQQEKEEQHDRILTDDSYGMTKEERVDNLNSAKKMAKILNAIGAVIAVVVLFIHEGTPISVGAAIVAPVVFILILKKYKGLIKIDQRKNSPYPSIFIAVFGPIIALLLRSVLAYDILDYKGIWSPAILIAMFFFSLTAIGTSEFKSRKPEDLIGMMTVLALAVAYGFSVIVALNCEYDNSTPNQYDALVLEKRIGGSKSKSYYLKLSPWGPRDLSKEVSVSREMYEHLNIKNPVHVYLYQGRLEVPWFLVTD